MLPHVSKEVTSRRKLPNLLVMRHRAVVVALCFVAACAHPASALTVTAAPSAPSPSATSGPGATTSHATISAASRRTASPAAIAAIATPLPTPPPIGASVGGCQLFPADNAWRTDISAASVDPNSANYVASITAGGSGYLHPDFGSNKTYGIPFIVVPKSEPKIPIHFTLYGDQSDKGPYPVPLSAPIESGSDHHVLAVQKGTCKLYEMYAAVRKTDHWNAGSGAVFDLNSDALRPAGWTSADAAGLPILPGLVRRSEIAQGVINHALRFTAPHTQRGYVDPARHYASSSTDPNLPPMGLRLRLKASFDLSGYHGASLIILTALKKYGMILADNGSSWYISGATDTGWDDTDLNQMKTVPGTAFEVVQHGPIHS